MALTVIALVLPGLAAGVERNGQGPLYVRSQNPGQAFRLTSPPHDARGLPAGTLSLGLYDTITNIWGRSRVDNYLLDFHMNDAGIFLGRGVNDRLTLGLAITERRIVNAHLDQLVLNVHKVANLDQDGRRDVPKNDLRIAIPEYGVDLGYAELENRLISRSGEAFASWQWLQGGNTALSASAFVQWRHELSEEALVQEDSNDAALGLSFNLPLDDDIFYLNLYYTRLGQAELADIPIRRELAGGVVSWEHVLTPNSSFYAQYMVDRQIFRGLGELSRPAHQLQLGGKWCHNSLTWQVALVENVIKFTNSPDISISLGLRYDFRP